MKLNLFVKTHGKVNYNKLVHSLAHTRAHTHALTHSHTHTHTHTHSFKIKEWLYLIERFLLIPHIQCFQNNM